MAIMNANLSAPWYIFYEEVNAMFKNDRDIHIIYDAAENDLKLFVDNQEKAEALEQILPKEKNFGNLNMKISVIPANNLRHEDKPKYSRPRRGQSYSRYNDEDSDWYVYERALMGNPAFVYQTVVDCPGCFNAVYVVFRKEVVQFFNDDLRDVNGLCSTLYENIARDIFVPNDKVCFCTDTEAVNGDC